MTKLEINHDKIALLYEDEHLIAVNKPSGLLCVPGLSSPDNLFDQVREVFPDARVVHRLDMSTSGIVLFPLNYQTQRDIGQLFERRKMVKQYVALVAGKLKDSSGEVHSPLICDWPNRPRQKINWLSGKPSTTIFERLSAEENQSRVRLFPHTGRTHQLRVHMRQIGHPILGDALYHRDGSDKAATRLLLHAQYMKFIHPMTHKVLEVTSGAEF